VAPVRRFHSFNDDLRARFGDRVQRVTLSGGLVCPNPDGPEQCPYCLEAARLDPGYGQGFPVHEQIRRGINFSRRKGTASPSVLVTVRNPRGTCAPADHLRATIESATAQNGVVVIVFSAPPECVTDEILATLRDFQDDTREIWLEFESLPETWPVARDPSIRFGVTVGLESLDEEELVTRLNDLAPDAVGFLPPVIVGGTVKATSYVNGEIEEPELETFAAAVARILARLSATVAVHPLILTERSDQILGPRWALNRQKVQQAIGDALEQSGTSQGDRISG
jgi:radical SAM superfamily enzyme